MTLYQKSFFKKLYKVEMEIVKKMSESHEELIKMISCGSLDEESIKILEIITRKKILDKFYGKKADELWTKLKLKSVETNQK